jgi:hypothetical protein
VITPKTAPEVMLNEHEAVKRILHDFVILRLANDNITLAQLKVILEDSAKKIMRVFEDDLSEYRQMLLAMQGSGHDGPGGLVDLVLDAEKMRQQIHQTSGEQLNP